MIPDSPGVLDYIKAHAKLILAILTVVLTQVVDAQTADWIIAVAGMILTGVIPNDPTSIALVYPKYAERKGISLRDQRGEITVSQALVILIIVVAIVVLLGAVR